MRSAKTTLVFLSLLLLLGASRSGAVERTAYLFRYDDRSLVSVPLPAPNSGLVVPTVVTTFDWMPHGSAHHPDGRILTVNTDTDELVAVTPATGEVEVLCVLSEDVTPSVDLFWGIDGSLMCVSGHEFHRIDPGTGAMTLLGTCAELVDVISAHEGRYLAWAGNRFLTIDPGTFGVTVVFEIPTSPFGSQLPWGLTSVGGYLWTGVTLTGMPPYQNSYVFTLDPFAGQYGEYVEYVEFVGLEDYTALEVIEQPSPAQVPALQRTGILMLILGFAVAGGVMLWRR